MSKIVYFQCPTGISGDMCLGALVSLGVSIEYLIENLNKLGIEQEYKLWNELVSRNSQQANKIHVDLIQNHPSGISLRGDAPLTPLRSRSGDDPREWSHEQTKRKARLYLVYALIRDGDRNLWEWASKDPDFQGVRERFADLRFALMKKLNEVDKLPEFTGKRFMNHIEEILKEMNWK